MSTGDCPHEICSRENTLQPARFNKLWSAHHLLQLNGPSRGPAIVLGYYMIDPKKQSAAAFATLLGGTVTPDPFRMVLEAQPIADPGSFQTGMPPLSCRVQTAESKISICTPRHDAYDTFTNPGRMHN